ncbi:MAG: nucleoside monophosphate kinase [Planctomycetes bacterium]|nr:nucleoside monophosphate kinase [Planctomycetota bacterium]
MTSMPDPAPKVSARVSTQTPETGHLDPAIEHAQLIFREAWNDLETQVGRESLRFPKEIIWLNGAPGSGKGTNTPFILRERSITAPPIVVADLLNSAEFQKIKDSGNLVGDREVIGLMLRKLLNPIYLDGVIVDGFPRTKVQVETLKLFYQKMLELRKLYAKTSQAVNFPSPVFRITVLFVEEKESVERQLKRGRQVIAHNQRVRDTGVGEELEERATDSSEEAGRKRYRIFKEAAFEALHNLKKHFHYHVINAQGDIASVEKNIMKEFQYQSSLELDSEVLDLINHVPLASDIVLAARQNLVRRLESYERENGAVLKTVIDTIARDFMPVILNHAITGLAKITTENELFANPLAIAMLIDIFNERGYRSTATVEARDIPARINPHTNEIFCIKRPRYRFEIRFQGSVIRRGH